ncbi:peptidoglycan-binding domain-containing protein [Streptomyces sp. NPDC005485]|uniref:peptidoglycan-binding domain-containing protein n=1 Tax=Streptomyces sp. NPDC005485 TaxID=3155591 RepID=UPI0033A9B7A8
MGKSVATPRSSKGRTLTKIAAAVSTAALVTTGLAVTASAAAAASYPTCNAMKSVVVTGSRFTYQPYYSGTGSRNCVMGYGAQSNGVYALQGAIDTCYQDISRDGIYGTQTRTAVRNVQSAEEVGVDGEYGPITREAMKWPLFEGGNGSVLGCTRPGT